MACFAAEGFQATSMADIISMAQLSADAVYRYYPSKDDLIEAIVHRVIGATAARFDEMLADGAVVDPAEAVRLAVETMVRIAPPGSVDLTRVAVQTWGEALRNERVSQVVRGAYTTVRDHLEEVCRRAQAAGTVDRDADVADLAAGLLSLVVGFLLQRAVLGDVEVASYGRAVDALLA